MAHWQFSRAAGVAVVLLACLGAAEGQWYRNPVRAVEQAVRNPVSVVRDTVTAPVRPLQQAVERLPCSCKSGHITDKWDKQEALERKFCNGARCSTGCCGGVEYGQQFGGTEVINMASEAALKCAACAAGCAACAGTSLANQIVNALANQVEGIASAVGRTVDSMGDRAREWGSDIQSQLKSALRAIARDLAAGNKINEIQFVDFGTCRLSVEPGFLRFTSKTCVYCCNCVNNMDATRFYLAWRVRCRGVVSVGH